jgi:hypothetical protein
VHYAGAQKPWFWRLYPMHGWILLWYDYAKEIPDLYDSLPPTWFLSLFPAMLFILAVTLSLFTRVVSSPGVLGVVRVVDRGLFSKYPRVRRVLQWLGVNLVGAAALLGVPYILYTQEKFIPPVLSPMKGIPPSLSLSLSLFHIWLLPPPPLGKKTTHTHTHTHTYTYTHT